MENKNIVFQFILLTFSIAFFCFRFLNFFSHCGSYTVYNWVSTPTQFLANIPFAIYILSPTIASYIILKKHGEISSLLEWIKNVFYIKDSFLNYLYVFAVLFVYFLVHFVSNPREFAQPFYTFFLSLFGNIILRGLEKSGWMYILQPELHKRFGFVRSNLFVGVLLLIWHVPLFFIAGTNHGEGFIHFGMFSVQLISFRFVHGAIYQISGKGAIFMCILFHTLFNALSPIFSSIVMTWRGTILANLTLIIIALTTIYIHNKALPSNT